MKKYLIQAVVNARVHEKEIEARNMREAHSIALSYGHNLSNYGDKFLSSARAIPLKKKK